MELLGTISTWFLVFLIYSVLGWIMEVIVTGIENRKATNRGFLIGPVCPIYGFGALAMTLLLTRVENVVEIFLVAVGASAVLEYATSFIMEKLFHVRWWDYSNKPLNIRGRICAENLLGFGILGVMVIKVINPILFGLLSSIVPHLRIAIAAVLLLVLLADIGLSLWLVIVCRVTVGTVQLDATDEITARVREILMNRGKLNRRLVKAFPEMEAKKKTPRTKKKSSRRSSINSAHSSSAKPARSSSSTHGKTSSSAKAPASQLSANSRTTRAAAKSSRQRSS